MDEIFYWWSQPTWTPIQKISCDMLTNSPNLHALLLPVA